MILTLQTLRGKGACLGQREKFKRMFGQSANVTVRLCLKVAHDFDFSWAAQHLLSPTAWAEYERVKASAWAEYGRVTATALAVYERATATSRAEYERVKAPALAEYERVKARAFALAYNNRKIPT